MPSPEEPQVLKAAYWESAIAPHLPSGIQKGTPHCPVFDLCGGCHLQRLSYEDQLTFKHRWLEHTFREAGLSNIVSTIEKVRANHEHPLFYRNKADFSARTWDDILHLGYRAYGGGGPLVECPECSILMPSINTALGTLRNLVADNEHLRRKLVSLVIRSTLHEGRINLLYHSKQKDPDVYMQLTEAAAKECSLISGGTFVKKRREFVWGTPSLTEVVSAMEFTYPVRGFFQSNPFALPLLCQAVEELATPCTRSTFADVYCGVGLFAILLAAQFKEVIGIESSPLSLIMSKHNADKAGLTNTAFLRGTAEDRLPSLHATGSRFGLIVLDPPRSGLHDSVIATLIRLSPSPVIVLVSCNPTSLARNLRSLQNAGYCVERVIPVDMFPQTLHLEVAVRLTRQS